MKYVLLSCLLFACTPSNINPVDTVLYKVFIVYKDGSTDIIKFKSDYAPYLQDNCLEGSTGIVVCDVCKFKIIND